MDSFERQVEKLPAELKLQERRQRKQRKAWVQLVQASAEGEREAAGEVTESEWRDLVSFHELIAHAFAIRQTTAAVYAELELAQAQLSAAPVEHWHALIDLRNQAQEKYNDCLVKTQFIAKQIYCFPEFFRDYVPLAVIASRGQVASV